MSNGRGLCSTKAISFIFDRNLFLFIWYHNAKFIKIDQNFLILNFKWARYSLFQTDSTDLQKEPAFYHNKSFCHILSKGHDSLIFFRIFFKHRLKGLIGSISEKNLSLIIIMIDKGF